MDSKSLVSVIITVYNGMPYIRDAVEALLLQTYENLEIIIIDDGSADETPQYLATLVDKRIRVFREKRIGRGKALNLALKHAQGEYIAINDADDISFPDRIDKQVCFLESNQEYGLLGTHSRIKNLKTGEIKHHSRPVHDEKIRELFTKGQPIQHVTVLMRKKIVEEVGGYNEKIPFLFDRDIFLRMAQVSKLYNLEDELVEVGQHNNRYFAGNFTGITREILSLKYRIKAIYLFDYSKFWIVREIIRSIWTLIPAGLRYPAIRLSKLIKKSVKR
jgi:glycosyltransferase involved in cell wall biosynthesis